MTQIAFIAVLLSCVVGIDSACRTTGLHQTPCVLTYESLSDEEAYKEVVIVEGVRIGFAQHESDVEYAQITPAESAALASALERIKNAMSGERPPAGYGEFLRMNCKPGPDLYMDLARARESTWRALERFDAILTRHFPDYVSISRYARWVRGG